MNTPITTPTQPWHVIERSQEDVITSVWSFNTQREAVDAMTAQINQQAEHNQALRGVNMATLRGERPHLTGDESLALDKEFRWSTFSVAQCTGSSICPACLGVRLLPTQPEGA